MTQRSTTNRSRYYGCIVNAKELESLHHEIDNLKKRRSDREDELLAVLEMREGAYLEAGDRPKSRGVAAVGRRGMPPHELDRIRADVGERQSTAASRQRSTTRS